MQKSTLFCLFFLLSFFTAFSQTMEGTVTVNKKQEPAILVELPVAADVAEKAIRSEMKKLGHVSKESKGFMVFKDVLIEQIGRDRVDLYIKTERRSRKDKDASVVYLGVAKGSEQFIGRDQDAAVFSGTRAFAERIPGWAQDMALELDIAAQEDVLKKAEKKWQNLLSDSASLDKRMIKLTQEIQQNKIDLSKQAQEIEAQKKVVENLKARRRD